MAPKKKIRNNKAKKNTESAPRPASTIPCQRCGADIVVPKTCKHGKKLVNCQGTGCTTAHIDEHMTDCPVSAASASVSRLPAPAGSRAWRYQEFARQNMPPENPYYKVDTWTDLAFEQETSASVPSHKTPDHSAAMGRLTVQLMAVIKTRGGKAPKYVATVPWALWYKGLEQTPISSIDEWAEKLKDVAEGRKSTQEIGYDDEDSDDEGACPTPEDEDEV